MEDLKVRIQEILNTRYVASRGIDNLSKVLAQMLRQDVASVKEILIQLIDEGEVYEFAKNKFAGARVLGLIKGKFVLSSQNFGFVLCDGGDIFVSKKNSLGAFDGDEVLVKVVGRAYKDKKREGKVLKIISRDNDNLLATYRDFGSYGIAELDRKNIQVKILKQDSLNAQEGDKVVIDIVPGRAICGKVIEVIGSLDKKGNDIKYFLRQNKVRETFPQEVLDVAGKIPQEVDKSKLKNRVDLTNEIIFTIDGVGAKDLDDAISLKKDNMGNYVLGVHIADVGEYVKLNGIIDKEAYERGTSIYFLNYVIPMLPKELSNGICSLNPGVIRLTLSVEMKINDKGEVIDSKIFESYIKSKHRLNYDEVLEVIEGNVDTQNRLSDIKDVLLQMYELSQILDKRRTDFGALNFEIPEGEVVLDENGKAIDVVKSEATKSTKLIETFMVVANETVALTYNQLKIPFVYRVHEKPDGEKIKSFFNFVDSLGLKLPSETGDSKDISPKYLQKILEEVKQDDKKGVVNMVMLRSLKKAKYFEKCLGHFGMALKFYCHFTSPIRRYPDLTIHRIIKEHLHGNLSFVKSKEMQDFVVKSSEKSSIQERVAEDTERAITDYKKCEYLENYIGKEFPGIISGVTNRGFFVELDNTCEGLVPMSSLKEFYNYDEERLMLVSKNHFFRIGERVQIKVESVDKLERKVNFEFIKKIRE